MIVERVVLNEFLPVLICYNESLMGYRYIISFYGAGMHKELVPRFYHIRELVNKGYKVLIPELYKHGERVESGYNKASDRLEVAKRAADEAVMVLDHFLGPKDTCSAIGGSLGGLCALASAVRDSRIKAMTVYTSFFSWSHWADSSAFSSYNPGVNYPLLADRKLKVLLGELDNWACPDFVWSGIEPLSTMIDSQSGGELQFEVIKGCGHQLTVQMEKKLIEWITERT